MQFNNQETYHQEGDLPIYSVAVNNNTEAVLKSFPVAFGESGNLRVNVIANDGQDNSYVHEKIVHFSRSGSGVFDISETQTMAPSQRNMNGCSFRCVGNQATGELEIRVTGMAKPIRFAATVRKNSIRLVMDGPATYATTVAADKK